MYSQYEEERHILLSVGNSIGQFLDLGAWRPMELSNTRALFELGWSGVFVEPSPGPFMQLVECYASEQRATLVNASVGLGQSLQLFHATDDAVSTSDKAHYEAWKETGGYYGSFYIPQFTLEDLFHQFGSQFDFINIDTEGNSVPLLFRLMELGIRPKCFCVEHDGRVVEVAAQVQESYRIEYLNGTNMILSCR